MVAICWPFSVVLNNNNKKFVMQRSDADSQLLHNLMELHAELRPVTLSQSSWNSDILLQ